MRKTRLITIAGMAAATALALTACGSDSGSPAEEVPAPAEGVTLEGSPTFDAMTARGGAIIGVKEDQPGLGYLDAATGERTGFDVDIARWIAAELGFSEDDIEFKAIASANREQAIINEEIDFYVGTYSITDGRKELIDFAGPYFVTGQGLLVAADSTIASDADLTSDVTVCSATGSTPIQNIRENYDAQTVEYDTYSLCVEALRQGQVDAVTTDEAILIGYAAQYPDELKVVGEPFSVERYGVGLRKGDDVLRDFINDLFEEGSLTWQEIYDANLGSSGTVVEQPEVDRY